MRTLQATEILEVAGGDWEVGFNLGVLRGSFSGDESPSEAFAAIESAATTIYYGAVDTMADFFTWWDPNNYYSSCGGGGGW